MKQVTALGTLRIFGELEQKLRRNVYTHKNAAFLASWYKNYVESLCKPPKMRSVPDDPALGSSPKRRMSGGEE
jgi:hypothetical protein